MEVINKQMPFIGDGGEMGALIRKKDWSATSLGSSENWPQSLYTTLSIILNSKFPMFLFWGPDLICFYNDAYSHSLGTDGKHPAALGMKGEWVWSEAWPYIKPIIDIVLSKGSSNWSENQWLPLFRNGHLEDVYWTFSFSPVHDETGDPAGVFVTCIETTKSVHFAKKIAESENNLRNMILQAPVAMCIFKGAEQVVEIANTRMIELWGKTAEAVLHKPLFEGLPEVRNHGFEKLLHKVYTTGETFAAFGVPINLPRAGVSRKIYINFVYEAFRDSDGRITGVMAVANDVTEQVLASEKIKELVAERTAELATVNRNLQKSNAELEQFAYIASHDLQEPVRKVSTFIQMLERNLGEVDARSKNYLNKISASTDRMLNLIKDVLAFSQLSKEKEIFEPVDLQNIMAAIHTDFELQIAEKQATIEWLDLPVIEAIPLQMSQLFGNLISNALKFSRHDQKPVITVKAEIMTNEAAANHNTLPAYLPYYQITFSDNGIGFNPENSRQIFHIFQRLHGRAAYSGTGIGLAMCKKITENHHGDIYATANEQTGAVFTVILPSKQLNG